MARLHLQIIFLSNILSASGLRIDPTVLWHWDPSAMYSTKKGPKRSQQSLTLSSGERPWKTFAPAGLESIASESLLLRHTRFMPGNGA
jgi:hypothetical protein